MKTYSMIALLVLLIFPFNSKSQNSTSSFVINKLTTSAEFINQSKNGDVETLGKWHNEGLDYILTELLRQNIGANDSRYSTVSISLLKTFYKNKGIEAEAYFNGDFKQWYEEQPLNICNLKKNLSREGTDIICSIQTSIDNLTNEQTSLEQFISEMTGFIYMSKQLSDEAERYQVGLTASIAKNSFEYWNQNFDTKYAAFSQLVSNGSEKHGPMEKNNYKIRWWMVGLADVAGALNWGSGGAAIGGVHGAVAAGLVGACYQSGTSILAQTVVHQLND